MQKHLIDINQYINKNNWLSININTPFKGLDRFTGFNVQGQGATDLSIQYRYSLDGNTYTEWKNSTYWDISLSKETFIWFNFRVKSESSFKFDKFELVWEKGELTNDKCEFYCRVYDQNSFITKCNNQAEYNTAFGAVQIWEELSLSVFQRFGWPIIYFKVNGIKQSKDYVFNEISLLEVSDCKGLQIVIPNNDFGSGEYQFTEFDIDFSDDLGFQINKEMFWSAFGHLETPAEKDFIYFPLEGRMFRVNSVQESKDFMRKSFWWKGTLVKWNESDSIYKSDKIKQTLDEIILNYSNTDFEKLNDEEGTDLRVEQQYVNRNISGNDNVRETVDIDWESKGVVRENLTNFYTVFSKYQYNLLLSENREIIKYKENIPLDKNLGIMFWYKGSNKYNEKILFGGNKEIRLTNNNTHITNVNILGYNFTVNIPLGNWYAWYIGVNHIDNSLVLRVFSRVDNKNTIQMDILEEKICKFSDITGNWTPRLYGSDGFITSIRFLKDTVRLEDLSELFTQLIFKDSSKSYIIDECWKIINLEKMSGR